MGGVLSQQDDEGRERVISYFSRKLIPAERHYTVTEIELLAAIEAIKQWRPYLWGRQFKLVIDHSALRWLHTMRDTMEGGPASRLMRWILKLQEYNFTVEHKPGVLHKDADGVSRLVCAATRVPHTYVAPVTRTAVHTARRQRAARRVATDRHDITTSYLDPGAPTIDTLLDEQLSDSTCAAIRSYLETGHAGDARDADELRQALWLAREVCPEYDSTTQQYRRRMYVGTDNVLYRRLSADRSVPFVPESLRPALLTAYHDHLGHPSSGRLHSLLRARYYWPNQRVDAVNYVNECHECTLSKHSRRHRNPIGPTVGRYPFDVLYADILSMTETHDYDKEAATGSSKLVVFSDSLSRWVEAIPVHKDPTSAQILDIFMEHIVSRHGVPRRIVTDHGSNLASRLCRAIMGATGVDLRPSAAEHHEAVGTVERFHQTLVGMARASNEGGSHWVDHLPFLLMSYRATPNRVTQSSPSMLLYGREIRLPAQLQGTTADASDLTGESLDDPTALTEDGHREYAQRLHDRLVYAWRAAHDHTRSQQGETVSSTVSDAAPPVTFAVGDRVARRLYDSANKLEYLYAGPYRVDEVLGNGRYRLTDLENNYITKEFDVSNLRPYRTLTDSEQLQSDEYLVDEILKHRTVRGQRQYSVKWRGYPRSQASWITRSELERRCADMVATYEASITPHPRRRRYQLPDAAPAPAPAPAPQPPSSVPVPTVDEHLPHVARFERGRWLYGRTVTSPRGTSVRMYPAQNFTATELASEHFAALRRAADHSTDADPIAASAIVNAMPDGVTHAAKVWFARAHRSDSSQFEILSFVRSDSDPDKPQYDTFGGKVDPRDDCQYHRCALRELREEFNVPRKWKETIGLELASFPRGRRLVQLTSPSSGQRHAVATWIVLIPNDLRYQPTSATHDGLREMVPGTLKWRPYSDVSANLLTFRTFEPTAAALGEILEEVTADWLPSLPATPSIAPPVPPPEPQPAPPSATAWARCARPECPCTSSWNGKEGEYCGRACQHGKPCALNFHRRPRLSENADTSRYPTGKGEYPTTVTAPSPSPPSPAQPLPAPPSVPPLTPPSPLLAASAQLRPTALPFLPSPDTGPGPHHLVHCVRCNLLFDAGLYFGAQPTCRQCRADLLRDLSRRSSR